MIRVNCRWTLIRGLTHDLGYVLDIIHASGMDYREHAAVHHLFVGRTRAEVGRSMQEVNARRAGLNLAPVKIVNWL